MKNQLAEKRMEKVYKEFYSCYNKGGQQIFENKKETKVEGLISWVELPADSEMHKLKILVGKEVM
jgi:hypothetical protein